jgi:hypothetical protein
MPLDRASFLACPPPKVEQVDVPELGDFVFVRALTAGERDQFEVQHVKSKEKDFRARLVAATACDGVGSRLFTEADVPTLSNLPAAVLEPLVQAATKINRLSADDVEDLRKN